MSSTDDENKETEENVPVFCSQRWILAYVGFFGCAVAFALRVNLSVAIVCMVKSPVPNVTSSDNVTVSEPEAVCGEDAAEAASSNERAEFEWDSTTRSTILAAFYYGYVVGQVPGGILADRLGGKRILAIELLLSSAMTILTPICARTSIVLVYVVRVGIGLCLGGMFPAFHTMWGHWAPALERSKLTAFCYTGTMIGNIITFSTSGLLCQYGFDNGWGSIFYLTGALTISWVFAWSYFTADTPHRHRRITQAELDLIDGTIGYNEEKKATTIPWRSIFKAPCVWALITGHFCRNWTFQTMLILLPTFMKDVLKFDIKANGALSAVPFLGMFLSSIVTSQFADYLRKKQCLSTTTTRKLFQSISFVGVGSCLVGTGFCSCEQRTLAVILLTIGQVFLGFSLAGVVVNHVDFAPKYAGVLFGITNTAASVPGMVSPILAGYLTPNKTPEEWRNVFYVCAGLAVFGLIIFDLFASGELQEWAKDSEPIQEPNVDSRENVNVSSICDETEHIGNKVKQVPTTFTVASENKSEANNEVNTKTNSDADQKVFSNALILKVE